MANITGTGNDDILPGTTLDDFISGLGGRDTITAGDGNDIIVGGLGADTTSAGNGDDEIWGGGTEWAAGEVIDGGAGNNKLCTWGGDISNVTITNVQTLGTHLNTLSLRASQLAAFSALITYGGPLTLQATEAGTYSLQGKSVTGVFSITGSSGNDYLAGNGAAQTLAGGDGNDRLQGLGGADILLGGNGDDEFLTGFTESPAGETIDGGAGFNTISSWNVDLSNATISNVQKLNAALDRVTLTAAQLAGFTTLTTGSAQIDLIAAGAGTYSLQGKSVTGKFNLIGSTGNDYLAGNGAAQTLTCGAGNDVLQGAGGADVMLGGDGDDEFLTGFNESVNETIDGGAGNNTLSSWNADLSTATISNIQTLGLHLDRVTLTAAQFNSFGIFNGIIAYDGPFTIYAATPGIYFVNHISDTQDYTFVGSSGVDWISDVVGKPAPTTHRTFRTGDGNDVFQLGTDHDTVYAGIGDDTIGYWGGVDQLYGEEGDDTFELRQLYYGDNFTIDGGSGFNTLTIYGADTDISSASISNIQQLNIYAQSVTLTAEQLNSFNNIVALAGSTTIRAANAGTYQFDFTHSYTGRFDLVGSDESDTLFASPNIDVISGGDGNDHLQAFVTNGVNNTKLYGDAGNDTIDLMASRGFTANGGDGNDTIIENETGRGYADGGNTMYGGNGDDVFLIGRAAVGSTIDGGTGLNTIRTFDSDGLTVNLSDYSIANIQTLSIGQGSVSLTASQFSGITNIVVAQGQALLYATGGGVFDLRQIQANAAVNLISDNRLFANPPDAPQTLIGDDYGQLIIGGGRAGNVIYGYGGNDQLFGAQFIYGGDGDDQIENGSAYVASDGTSLYGESGNDMISGSIGSDYMDGGSGNDQLNVYLGNDVLNGGSGDDIYSVQEAYGETTATATIVDDDASGFDTAWIRQNHDRLWFTQTGDDLTIQIIGTGTSCVVQDWYAGSQYHVEQIQSSDGKTLLDSQVQNIVNAMAGLAVPTTTTLPAEYHTILDPILAANWT